MNILQVHNAYSLMGGEDAVVEEEKNILEKNGHKVVQFIKVNKGLNDQGIKEKLKIALTLRYSEDIKNELTDLIRKNKFDICHVHNIFPLITPGVYDVCHNHGIPVVQTLHNYRLICTNSLLYRDKKICEVCIGRSLKNSIKYKCYRNSYLQTALMADSIQHHRHKNTWNEKVSKYICMTDFAKQKFIDGGLPAIKLLVKPNFIINYTNKVEYNSFFLYAGRMEEAKGLYDFILLAKKCENINFIAIGPCRNPEVFAEYKNINYLGELNRVEVLEYISKCRAVLFLSKSFEGMPMTILEAFSCKKPVIGRDLGAMSGLISHGINGLKFQDLNELILHVHQLNLDISSAVQMGEEAYQEYNAKYAEAQGYKNLIDIYTKAIQQNGKTL
jgi:glycosyltransferase involved in cell wall biosynthesis